jgi:hypothetical protein
MPVERLSPKLSMSSRKKGKKQQFRELTPTTGRRILMVTAPGCGSETGEHGGDYPDNMPQAITVTDAQGRWAVYLSRCEPAARSSLADSQSRCRYEAVVDLSIEFGSAMLSLPPCQSQG